jgi:hypothetical protein
MDIFRLLYAERLKPSATAAALNREPSGIARELEKGMDNGDVQPGSGRSQASRSPKEPAPAP